MRATRGFALIFAVLVAACGDEAAPIGPTPDAGVTAPDAAPQGIPLRDWVTSMTDVTRDDALPDTVEGKMVIDTDDPAAFDSFLTEP